MHYHPIGSIMATFFDRGLCDAIANGEEFDNADDVVGFLGNNDLANHSLPDNVVVLSYLGHIAVISQEYFV
jgi:hypothetical protein